MLTGDQEEGPRARRPGASRRHRDGGGGRVLRGPAVRRQGQGGRGLRLPRHRGNRLVERLIKGARLRFPHADISNIVYEGRPLSRDLVRELGTAQFVETPRMCIIEGFTVDPGKSHLACAIAKQAWKRGPRSLYVRMPDMLAYREEKMAAGWPEKKVLNKYVGYKVLVIDENLIDKPTTDQMHFLLEVTERRYDNSSTIYCSQYPVDEWHRRMGGGAHAESVMDRIVHNAVRNQMGGRQHQGVMAKRKVERAAHLGDNGAQSNEMGGVHIRASIAIFHANNHKACCVS